MHPINHFALDELLRARREALESEVAHQRLLRECNRDGKGTKEVRLKYRLLAVLGLLGALAWFLH